MRLAPDAFLLVTLLVLATAGPAQSGIGRGPARPKGTQLTHRAPTVAGEVGKTLDELMTSPRWFPSGFNGLLLVAKGGEVLLEKGYGLRDAERNEAMPPDALIDWCSVTKQFTSACLLRLEMQKKLSIDDPLAKHFPKAPADKAKVTLRQLMNHTSGLSNRMEAKGVDLRDRAAAERAFLALPMESEPGKKWAYNNIAYALLAIVIEKTTGKTWEKAMHELVFTPAGMKEAFLVGEPELDIERVAREQRGKGPHFAYGNKLSWGYAGMGGAVVSTRDMLVWDRALRGDKLLNEAAKKKYYEVGREGYALGWHIEKRDGDTRISHTGRTGEVITTFLRLVDEDVVVAIAYTCEEGAFKMPLVVEDLLKVVRTGKLPGGWKAG